MKGILYINLREAHFLNNALHNRLQKPTLAERYSAVSNLKLKEGENFLTRVEAELLARATENCESTVKINSKMDSIAQNDLYWRIIRVAEGLPK